LLTREREPLKAPECLTPTERPNHLASFRHLDSPPLERVRLALPYDAQCLRSVL
jgi:hypothetical protein